MTIDEYKHSISSLLGALTTKEPWFHARDAFADSVGAVATPHARALGEALEAETRARKRQLEILRLPEHAAMIEEVRTARAAGRP